MEAKQASAFLLIHFLTRCATLDLRNMTSFEPNKKIRIDKLGNCTGAGKAPILIKYENVHMVNNIIIFKGSATVRENISEDMIITSKIEKCEGKFKADCVHMAEFSAKNLCDAVENRDKWKSVMKNFHPRLKCPLKKGVYTVSECEFETTPIAYTPFDKGFYRVTMQIRGQSSGRLMACTLVEGRIVARESP